MVGNAQARNRPPESYTQSCRPRHSRQGLFLRADPRARAGIRQRHKGAESRGLGWRRAGLRVLCQRLAIAISRARGQHLRHTQVHRCARPCNLMGGRHGQRPTADDRADALGGSEPTTHSLARDQGGIAMPDDWQRSKRCIGSDSMAQGSATFLHDREERLPPPCYPLTETNRRTHGEHLSADSIRRILTLLVSCDLGELLTGSGAIRPGTGRQDSKWV